ncbi:type I-MYXAN CRISPR-associated protein Cas6/Cmx6 [Hyalangium versicolor]|uniref:type I-MYXAN CRISPR-associated protein Cas6/Cmx6 n=1 Tax=Hyalangium versicolor TaxID=2861190 RepID=UPI001CCFEBBF|nr:type I-MYXAN CRISPR-associated protein Cas6/Cmx6 [Hyalangium versicolor]
MGSNLKGVGMPVVDLLFPARSGVIPIDHGYLLFSALAARIHTLHERQDIGIFNLRGENTVGESLYLGRGTMRLRCPAEAIPLFLGLVGSPLDLAGRHVTLGPPTIRALEPVARLSARIVTFKHSVEEGTFRATAQRFIEELTGTSCSLQVVRRRIVTIAGTKVVGFGLELEDLKPESSMVLQEKGLGGRRHMGCGLFLPKRASR